MIQKISFGKYAALALASILALALLSSTAFAGHNGADIVIDDSAACGETTFTASITDPAGTHKVSNMKLIVHADGVTQVSDAIPTDGTAVSITVGPFTEDQTIQWRVFGGDERDYDLPLWNGYGGPTFGADIGAYGTANGYGWVIAGPEDPNTFTTWNEVEVEGCVPPPVCPVGTTQSTSPVETVTVNSASSVSTASTMSLLDGVTYLLVSSGTWQNSLNVADTEYTSIDNWTTHMDGYDINPWLLGEGEFDLQVDSNFLDWGSYSSAHEYSYLYTGTGAPANFLVFDGDSNTGTANPGWYGDNSGSLSVDIYSCTPDAPEGPADMNECKKGGWEEFGFKNQGQCIRFVNTGKDSR